MKKLIIFDYDGVIADSFPALHKTYQKICQHLNKKCPEDLDEFRKTYGRSSRECYERLGFTDEEILIGNKLYKELIVKKNVQPFEGIIETIEELSKSYNMAVVSSSPLEVIQTELERFGLLKYFKKIIGRTNLGISFPRKGISIREVIQEYSTAENTISIGDRIVDFTESSKAGLKNILLVNYGWGYDVNLIPEYNQRATINKPSEIINAVKLFD